MPSLPLPYTHLNLLCVNQVISTDPAHSLGDLLDQKVSGGKPVEVMGCENLWAMEVDTEGALARFRELFAEFDVASVAAQFGVSEDLLANLGTGLQEGWGVCAVQGRREAVALWPTSSGVEVSILTATSALAVRL